MMHSGVYRICNIVTGKVYIGSGISIRVRRDDHFRKLIAGKHGNRYLQRAWNKYGDRSFTFETIERCTVELLLTREQYWMDYHRSYDPAFGYNLSPTAGSVLGIKHSEEFKRARSKTLKDLWDSPRGEEMRASLIERSNKRKGKPASEALLVHLNKINMAKRGKKQSLEVVEKRIAPLRGKKQSEDLVRKRAEALRIYWSSPAGLARRKSKRKD